MNVAIVIQARLGSKRFPRKVLTDICGKSLLQRLHDRTSRWLLGDVIIAVPDADEIEIYGAKIKKGSEDDVLARFVSAVDECDYVLRVTADCPIFDIDNAYGLVERASWSHEDYLSLEPEYGWPKGADLELISWEALLKANWLAKEPHEREHVTPFIRNDKTLNSHYPEHEPYCGHLRLCIDTPDDAYFVNEVWSIAQQEFGEFFSIEDALWVTKNMGEIYGEATGC